jgi:hypothetical protein
LSVPPPYAGAVTGGKIGPSQSRGKPEVQNLQEDRNLESHSHDLNASKIESIEEILKRRGFFETPELEQKEEEVLV